VFLNLRVDLVLTRYRGLISQLLAVCDISKIPTGSNIVIPLSRWHSIFVRKFLWLLSDPFDYFENSTFDSGGRDVLALLDLCDFLDCPVLKSCLLENYFWEIIVRHKRRPDKPTAYRLLDHYLDAHPGTSKSLYPVATVKELISRGHRAFMHRVSAYLSSRVHKSAHLIAQACLRSGGSFVSTSPMGASV
jgi:hypothetical protein